MTRRIHAVLLLLLFVSGTAGATEGNGIQEARFVTIGGIEQWITIRGSDRANPALLILHGGPGDVLSPFATTFSPLERSFTVVQWDQRGAGKTLAREGSAQSTSIEQLISDCIELTEYVKAYLHTDRVILVGHSFGSWLGVTIVKRNPQLYRAFVGTGQVVSWKSKVTAQYQVMLKKLRFTPLAPEDAQWMRGMGPNVTPEEYKVYSANSMASLQNSAAALEQAVVSSNLPALGYRFPIPYFLIQGEDDMMAPTSVAVEYFRKIKAPRKEMTLIKGGGHFAMMMHMPEFVQALEEDVRSLPP